MGKLFKTNADKNFGINLDSDDFELLKERVFSDFGYPLVKVEMTDKQFLMVIHAAVEYLNTYSPKLAEVQTMLNPQVADYYFDSLDRDLTGVLDVYFPVDWHIMQGASAEILFPEISMIRASNDATVASDFVTKHAQHQLAMTIFGCNPTPELMGPRHIRLSPRPIMESRAVFRVTTDHDQDLGSLDDYEKNWLIKFCIARASKVIGRVRSKYSGTTLPLGDLSSDGKDLINDGKEDEKTLIEEIQKRRKFAESYIFLG